jgi:hypothetical protein
LATAGPTRRFHARSTRTPGIVFTALRLGLELASTIDAKTHLTSFIALTLNITLTTFLNARKHTLGVNAKVLSTPIGVVTVSAILAATGNREMLTLVTDTQVLRATHPVFTIAIRHATSGDFLANAYIRFATRLAT